MINRSRISVEPGLRSARRVERVLAALVAVAAWPVLALTFLLVGLNKNEPDQPVAATRCNRRRHRLGVHRGARRDRDQRRRLLVQGVVRVLGIDLPGDDPGECPQSSRLARSYRHLAEQSELGRDAGDLGGRASRVPGIRAPDRADRAVAHSRRRSVAWSAGRARSRPSAISIGGVFGRPKRVAVEGHRFTGGVYRLLARGRPAAGVARGDPVAIFRPWPSR